MKLIKRYAVPIVLLILAMIFGIISAVIAEAEHIYLYIPFFVVSLMFGLLSVVIAYFIFDKTYDSYNRKS